MGNVSASGINCGNGGADCMETYEYGTVVNLIPTPDAVSTFVGFSGDADCADGMVTMDDNKNCTATFDYLPLLLGPIYPGIKNSINFMSATNSSPGGKVAFVWGFKTGSLIIGAPCPGLELGINPVQVLGKVTADAGGVAKLKFFVPSLGNTVLAYTQAVDIDTCRASEVVKNILRNN